MCPISQCDRDPFHFTSSPATTTAGGTRFRQAVPKREFFACQMPAEQPDQLDIESRILSSSRPGLPMML